jgi:hypothetical protein
LATHVDVYATVLKAARVPVPPEAQGLGLLHCPSGLPRGRALACPARTAVVCSELGGHALVTSAWKLAYYPASGQGFLWARRGPSRGPGRGPSRGWESRANQWGQLGARQVQAALLRALLRWRAQQHPFAAVWQQAGMRPAEGRDVAAARRAGRYNAHAASSASASTTTTTTTPELSWPGGKSPSGGKGNRKDLSGGKGSESGSIVSSSGLKLNRAGLPRKARVVDSALAMVAESLLGVDAELALQGAVTHVA